MKKFLKWAAYAIGAFIALVVLLNLDRDQLLWALAGGFIFGWGTHVYRKLDSIEKSIEDLKRLASQK